jgi:cell division protein FtsB
MPFRISHSATPGGGDQRYKDYQQRIARADQEIAELEAQRDELQKEVVDWQDYIDRQIGNL